MIQILYIFIELFVNWNEPKRGERVYPHCFSNRCVKKDRGAYQTVRHLPSGSSGILITFYKPRFLCKDCGHSFFVKPGWVAENTSVTENLSLSIVLELIGSTKCLKQIAHDTRTTPAIVKSVMDVVASMPAFNGRRSQLSEWLSTHLSCDIPEIRHAAKSIEIRRKGIENSWRFNKSNGPTEGLNRKIKDCRRMAFGAHDLDNFRKRALLACGCTKVTYSGYSVFNEKKKTVSNNISVNVPVEKEV